MFPVQIVLFVSVFIKKGHPSVETVHVHKLMVNPLCRKYQTLKKKYVRVLTAAEPELRMLIEKGDEDDSTDNYTPGGWCVGFCKLC